MMHQMSVTPKDGGFDFKKKETKNSLWSVSTTSDYSSNHSGSFRTFLFNGYNESHKTLFLQSSSNLNVRPVSNQLDYEAKTLSPKQQESFIKCESKLPDVRDLGLYQNPFRKTSQTNFDTEVYIPPLI